MNNFTVSANISGSSSSIGKPWNDFDHFTWVFLSPLVFFPGIIGNILTVIVMLRPAFRHTTTGVYLPLIAIADIIVLLSGLLPDWLEWLQVFSFKEYNVWTCRVHKFVFYSAGDVSIWLIVAFTLDRFVAVCFPLSKRVVCVPRRAAIAAVVITVLISCKNVHEFWTRGLEYNKFGDLRSVCGLPAEFHFFHAYIRPWIAFITITALPFTLILIFNCLIVRSLVLAVRMRADASHGGATGSSHQTAPMSSYRQTTLMCLSVSFAFLACILPSIVLLIGKIHWSSPEAPASTRLAYSRAKTINNMFVYVNHACNFILYCLTGRKFRDELKAMFTRCRRQGKAPNNTKVVPIIKSGVSAQKSATTSQSGLRTVTTDVCVQDSDD